MQAGWFFPNFGKIKELTLQITQFYTQWIVKYLLNAGGAGRILIYNE
jgi:hypothetical protein